MKYIIAVVIFQIIVLPLFSQTNPNNRALHLDGRDNRVCTGIGVIQPSWTLEAWIKGNDTSWKKQEAVFGGGEYSSLNIADNLPLVINNGTVGNAYAGLWSSGILDSNWHHVALSCNDTVTVLYLDGSAVGRKQIRLSVLPGVLGGHETDAMAFGGLMDEVRIWNRAISHHELKRWMNRPLTSGHPYIKDLVAYYNFDDRTNGVGVNWVGKGWQPYHLRNGRGNYKASAPLAYTTVNTNTKFPGRKEPQKLLNATVIHNEWDGEQGNKGFQVLKLRIAITGQQKPLRLSEVKLNLSGVSRLSDIERVHVYYAGKTATSTIRQELSGTGIPSEALLHFSGAEKPVFLSPGINYFIVAVDISSDAVPGGQIKITVPSFRINRVDYIPQQTDDIIVPQVTRSSKKRPEILKVFQWNIWHGGVHLGNNGVDKVIEILKASNADIITMQEAYGSQQRIADSLGFFMYTPGPNDNLAVFSRYKISPLPRSKNPFNSNPVMITLPGGRNVLVNSSWLRYSTKPEYTSFYRDTGLNPDEWIVQDSLNALADIKRVIEKDIKPFEKNDEMAVIIGGDFNSCSHLDWTKEAAPLHGGYGPVAFPVSRYLLNEGYKDGFREVHTDEVLRPEGTWSPIYGQLPNCRIDFLYHKGKNIKCIASKIVRTTPDIDDIWPSDHAAVISTYQVTAP